MVSGYDASAPKPFLTLESSSDKSFISGTAAVVFAVGVVYIYIYIIRLNEKNSL